MKNILLSQKKILIVILAAFLVFFIFHFFIYLPSSKSVLRIKSQLNTLEGQVKIIEEVVGKAKTIEAASRLLEERFQDLKNKFSSKEEESLKMLADLAKRVNIKFTSFTPLPQRPYLDENKNKIGLAGKSCQIISVHMEGKCFYYKDLVKYLELLDKYLPAYEVVEKLNITKGKPRVPGLDIILDIDLYFLI